MRCSLWRFEGDPDGLERKYLAVMAEVPESNHVLHAAAKTSTGCSSSTRARRKRSTASSSSPEGRRVLFEKHGLVPTTRDDYPVIRAFAAGERVDEPAA
jgi:hypothetical protein